MPRRRWTACRKVTAARSWSRAGDSAGASLRRGLGQGEVMDDGNGPLATLAAAYHDRERWAVAARQRGQKVIGYVSNNVPAELIWASGAFGVQLTGIPGETPTGDRYMEDFHEG